MSKTAEKPKPQPERRIISLGELTIDQGTQPRKELDKPTLAEYAAAFQAAQPDSGTEIIHPFPPVVVFSDGTTHWLADGFHRRQVYKHANVTGINAEVYPGSRRDAVLYSVGANAEHGLRRTNADKRRAVETLLQDEEWGVWNDSEIARQCCVSRDLVAEIRSHLRKSASETTGSAPSQQRQYTDKHGKTATMDTTNIGKKSSGKAAPKLSDDDAANFYEPIDKLPSTNGHGDGSTLAERVANAEVTHDTISSNGHAPASNGAAPPEIDEADMTDADWLQSLPIYRVIAALQGKGIILRRSLLDYRYLVKALATFQHHLNRCETVKHPDNTPLSTALSRVSQVKHPREWRVCAPCKGHGCNRCGNAGYDLSGSGIDPQRVERQEVVLA